MISNGETVGVGITTRNRIDSFRVCLRHFEKYSTVLDSVVVVDDNSIQEIREETERITSGSSLPITLKYSDSRLGIAKAKNACLAGLSSFDHVFLFDDDAWPVKQGWEEYWIKANKENHIGHSMWLVDFPILNEVIKKERTVGDGDTELSEFANCLGVALYFSRECLNAIGGYDASAKNVYGYEHAQMSSRAQVAGFTGGYTYLAPTKCSDYIYSIDISLNWMGIQPPLYDLSELSVGSSVTAEEVTNHKDNSILMSTTSVNIPLVDPLGE